MPASRQYATNKQRSKSKDAASSLVDKSKAKKVLKKKGS